MMRPEQEAQALEAAKAFAAKWPAVVGTWRTQGACMALTQEYNRLASLADAFPWLHAQELVDLFWAQADPAAAPSN